MSNNSNDDLPEKTRWIRLAAVTLCFVVLVSAAFYYVLAQVPRPGAESPSSSHLGFFLLINLNIIVVMVLGFMVIKNIVKLLLDRRRRILGSRLRARLVAAFVGLSLIPTILLFLMARGILDRVLEEWFSPQVTASVDRAFGVAQHVYDAAEADLYRYTRRVARDLVAFSPLLDDVVQGAVSAEESRVLLERFLEEKREEYGLYSIALVSNDGSTLVQALGLEARLRQVDVPLPNTASIQRARSGATVVAPEQSLNSEFFRGYAPVREPQILQQIGGLLKNRLERVEDGALPARLVVVTTAWISPQLIETLAELVSSYDDYRELRTYRRPLASNFVLTLVIVTLMIVFAAVWVGFYLARSLSGPIQKVAEGTQEVAQGNLDFRIPEVGDDELGILVRSFNKMTEDLAHTTDELVERRRYMEAVLAHIGLGVISIDKEQRIATLNNAARTMFAIDDGNRHLGQSLHGVLPEPFADRVLELLHEVGDASGRAISDTVTLRSSSGEQELQVTVTKLLGGENEILGAVFLFDDVTQLVSAQRIAAWRDVARRIAHEIKNPLTPIQLSAQRMRKRLLAESGRESLSGEKAKLVDDATAMISNQVETLRTLVNEFSQFARMPTARPQPTNLNSLIRDTVRVYETADNEVLFDTELAEELPTLHLDSDQMSRALVNLIDNGVASVLSRREHYSDVSKSESGSWRLFGLRRGNAREDVAAEYQPRISIRSKFEQSIGLVSVEVKDNGLGISEQHKSRLFEPYFSTKEGSRGSTGLGLAIVKTIVSDHNGFIRVRDNEAGGATFVIELPVQRERRP